MTLPCKKWVVIAALSREWITTEADKQNADQECTHDVDIARGLRLYKIGDDCLFLKARDAVSSSGVDISSGRDAAEEDQADHSCHEEIVDDQPCDFHWIALVVDPFPS